MAELRGIEYLRDKLALKRRRGLVRYDYYEQKNFKRDPGPVIPGPLQDMYKSCLGWCTKSVDSLADRLVFDGFDNDNFGMMEVFRQNNADVLFDSAVRGALINSCDFIYISADENGYPRLQVIDGTNATGILDPITNLMTEGYAVLERDDMDVPVIEAYFCAGKTDFYYKGEHSLMVETITNNSPYALLVPIIYRPDSRRPFGHSRISRACMDLVDKARNTITRAEVSGEFYAFPQKYITGLSQDAEPLEKWRATISSFLQFSKDDEGDKPVLGQFQQQSMTPFIDQFKLYASAFCNETGLTMDDMGFVTSNPSSAEAIKAGHEDLRLIARSAQRTLGTGFLNVGYLAACVKDDFAYKRKEIYQTVPVWAPIFEADFAALSSAGDGIIKINQSIPGYFDEEKIKRITGM